MFDFLLQIIACFFALMLFDILKIKLIEKQAKDKILRMSKDAENGLDEFWNNFDEDKSILDINVDNDEDQKF